MFVIQGAAAVGETPIASSDEARNFSGKLWLEVAQDALQDRCHQLPSLSNQVASSSVFVKSLALAKASGDSGRGDGFRGSSQDVYRLHGDYHPDIMRSDLKVIRRGGA